MGLSCFLSRIAMHSLSFSIRLASLQNAEVIIARLPECTALGFAQLARDVLLQHLQRHRKLRPLRYLSSSMTSFTKCSGTERTVFL